MTAGVLLVPVVNGARATRRVAAGHRRHSSWRAQRAPTLTAQRWIVVCKHQDTMQPAAVEASFQKEVRPSSACQPQVLLRLRGGDPCGSPADSFHEVSEALGIAHHQLVALRIPGANAQAVLSATTAGLSSCPPAHAAEGTAALASFHGATQISMRFDPSA